MLVYNGFDAAYLVTAGAFFYAHVFYGEWPLIAWSGQPNPNIKFNYRSNCHRTLCVWGRQRKSWLPSCSIVGVLLLCVSFCGEVGIKIRELAAVLLPAVLRTRVARVISFCLLRACLCPIYLSCRLLPGNGDWGTPNFFVVVIFARFFCRQFTNFTCYADERPWSENTSAVTLLGPQVGGGTCPLAYKGWYAFTPLGRGAFLSRHEEEPCSVAITIRICERWPGLAPQNDY